MISGLYGAGASNTGRNRDGSIYIFEVSMTNRHHCDDISGHSRTSGCISRRSFLELSGMATAGLMLDSRTLAEAFAQHGAAFPAQPRLAATHDLISLPHWGPYSKKHFGISHIPDIRRGLSFDLSIFPLPVHGPARLPSVTDRRSGVHPWEASPGLQFYSFRFETLPRHQLECDLSYSKIDDRSRLIRMELRNHTSTPQEIVVNCLAQLCFPPFHELTAQPIRLYKAELPPGTLWINALDYEDLRFARPRPTDNLVPDGKWRGEERRHDSVGGSVIAQGFGRDAGDWVSYQIKLKRKFSNAVLVWRYALDRGKSVTFQLGGSVRSAVTFRGTGTFTTVAVPLGPLSVGTKELRFTSTGGQPPALNGFALVEARDDKQIRFVEQPWHPVPAIDEAATENGLILKYQDAPDFYGYSMEPGWAGHRQLKWRDLDQAFHCESGPDTKARIFGSGSGRPGDPDSLFIHSWSKPLIVPPNADREIQGIVCTGSKAEVRQSLNGLDSHAKGNRKVYLGAKHKSFEPVSTPGAKPFDLSQRLMAAVTLTNLVYPLYTQGSYIRHFSPGKIWDCLYTWDAGFIGLGLLEIDARNAIDVLNAYTTPSGAQSAFIHHGTPLPVQIYLFNELWNRTQSRELLAYFYPRLRQYHRFLAGRLGSSTTRQHQDHLICTWDYFYNSGGWDDYPPQKFVHQQKITRAVAPVVNSSHTIRCAKLLRCMAEDLGETADFAEYDEDIAVLSGSLQKYSWDPESGYYGYVLHDESGKPTGILRTHDGINFNMGLDGVCPLIASICTPEQTRQILDHLFSAQHLWTDVGITTVDQTAPYYNPNGYWNGSVWFAHQWFLWKTMLDLGRGDLAVRIAQTGLSVWKRTADATWDCMEHFVPRPPYGEGWHQFSSLSSPALSWFAALFAPGRITCGFNARIQECHFRSDAGQLRAKIKLDAAAPENEFSVLACMPQASQYRIEWNGSSTAPAQLHDNLLHIQLPGRSKTGELSITAIDNE